MAQTTMQPTEKAVDVIVAIFIGALLTAFLLPLAINEVVAVDVSSWSSQAQDLWNVLDLALVLGAFIMLVGIALAQS